MEALLTCQREIIQKLHQVKVNFGKDAVGRKTPDYIKARLDTVDHLWNEFMSNIIRPSAHTAHSTTASGSRPILRPHNVSYVASDNEEVLLATISLKVQVESGEFIILRALLDQGSQISLISENAAQRLGLQRHRYHASIAGIGNGASQSKSMVVLKCQSIHDDYQFSTEALVISRVINNLPNISFSKQSVPPISNISLADPEYNISRPVDFLLDASVYSRIIMNGLIRNPGQNIIAQQTRLGWILSGNVKTLNCHVVINNLADISKYGELEDITTASSVITPEEQYCEDFYQRTTSRLGDGTYVVGIPMKTGFEQKLGLSKPRALAQFKQVENRVQKNQQLGEQYKQCIKEYQCLGHMHKAEVAIEPSCFLAHHCVLKSDSTTTSLRVVFNASAKTASGHSLNDLMECGPNLQQDQTLILNWRQFKYVIPADIEKMFRTILIRKTDQQLQKIIWRDSLQDPLQEYWLTTVTYGTKAAPFLAMRTLRQLATDDANLYPRAALALQSSFYMDDLLAGGNWIQETKELQRQLMEMLKGAGMNLRKWSSNESQLISDLAQDQVDTPLDFRCAESRKTLGLQWNAATDCFTFHSKLEAQSGGYHTKRQLLSDMVKILYLQFGNFPRRQKINFITSLLDRHGSITRVVRTIAWISRFITQTRISSKQNVKRAGYLTSAELNNAYNAIVKFIQGNYFSDEMAGIERKGHVSGSSKIISLNPFLDERGLLRVGGRLANASISEAAKHAVILPSHGPLARVIEVHPGKDGYVRVATLKTQNSTMKPVTKLVVLPGKEDPASDQIEARQQGERETSSRSDTATKHPSPRERRGRPLIKSLFTTLLLVATMISPTVSMVVYYNMTAYWRDLAEIREYVSHLNEVISANGLGNQYKNIGLQLQHELNEIDHLNALVKCKSRRKRGLIDGVGYVANSLFGVLDGRFAEQYEQDILQISQNENHLQRLLKNQTSIIEAEYNILRRHENIISQQFALVKDDLSALTETMDKMSNIIRREFYITSSAFAAYATLTNIKSIQQTLISSLVDLNQGRIDPHLLTPEQLQEQVTTIAGQLRGDLMLPIHDDNIRDIYRISGVTAKAYNNYLIIEIRIPIVSSDVFEVDRIVSIPHREGRQMYEKVPIFPYVVFNLQKDAVLFLSEHDLDSCTHVTEDNIICSINKPIYNFNIKQSICDFNIMGGKPTLCQPTVSACADKWLKLRRRNVWFYSCCEECKVRIFCATGAEVKILQGVGIIQLGQDCALKSDTFTIHGHNSFINNLKIEPSIEIPTDISILNDLLNSTVLRPSLEEPRADGQAALDQLAQQISQLKEQSETQMVVHNVHHYTALYVLLAAAVTAGCAVIYWRRSNGQRQGRAEIAERPQAEAWTASASDSAVKVEKDNIVTSVKGGTAPPKPSRIVQFDGHYSVPT